MQDVNNNNKSGLDCLEGIPQSTRLEIRSRIMEHVSDAYRALPENSPTFIEHYP